MVLTALSQTPWQVWRGTPPFPSLYAPLPPPPPLTQNPVSAPAAGLCDDSSRREHTIKSFMEGCGVIISLLTESGVFLCATLRVRLPLQTHWYNVVLFTLMKDHVNIKLV